MTGSGPELGGGSGVGWPDGRYRAGDVPAARARAAAEALVAQTFVGPVLKQLRESSEAAPPFAPGPGEKQFRALLDAELAQRMVSGWRLPLVERVARDLLRHHGADAVPTR